MTSLALRLATAIAFHLPLEQLNEKNKPLMKTSIKGTPRLCLHHFSDIFEKNMY